MIYVECIDVAILVVGLRNLMFHYNPKVEGFGWVKEYVRASKCILQYFFGGILGNLSYIVTMQTPTLH